MNKLQSIGIAIFMIAIFFSPEIPKKNWWFIFVVFSLGMFFFLLGTT